MSRLRSRILARTFVRRVIREVFGDFVNLAGRQHSSYKAIEESIRRRNKIPVHDLHALEETVKRIAPEACRSDLVVALTALSNAFVDELVVREQVAYILGLTVGQSFSAAMFRDVLEDRSG